MSVKPEPKKRGRKKKVDTISSNEIIQDTIISDAITSPQLSIEENITTNAPKKRGRKPKGGKIMPIVKSGTSIIEKSKNVILHLKCCLEDLHQENNFNGISAYDTKITDYQLINNNNISHIQDIDSHTNVNSSCDANNSCNANNNNNNNNSCNANNNSCNANNNNNNCNDGDYCSVNKEAVLAKINKQRINLSTNNISDKRSACFWCTYDFHNPPIFIPKREKHDGYEVYGCFCTPECGVAYLMNEIIDSSIKFERYQLMNYIYGKSLQYESNIKPAPDPHYLLDKYYGNLSIEEYRSTLHNNNYLVFVDKPLTHIFPEMFNDNHDFTLMNGCGQSNSLSQYKIKKASKSTNSKTKNDIVKESFGM